MDALKEGRNACVRLWICMHNKMIVIIKEKQILPWSPNGCLGGRLRHLSLRVAPMLLFFSLHSLLLLSVCATGVRVSGGSNLTTCWLSCRIGGKQSCLRASGAHDRVAIFFHPINSKQLPISINQHLKSNSFVGGSSTEDGRE